MICVLLRGVCVFEREDTSSSLYRLVLASKDLLLLSPQTERTASGVVVKWDWSQVMGLLLGPQLGS